MSDFNTMLKAAGLWRRTSAKGTEYFVGRLGGVKVLVLENRDKQCDEDPTHNLFFAEATAKGQLEGRDRGDRYEREEGGP